MVRRWCGLVVAAACASAACGDEAGSSARARAAVAAAIGASLGADAQRAMTRLNSVPAGEFEGRDAAFRDCMKARFATQPATEGTMAVADPFAARVVASFQAY